MNLPARSRPALGLLVASVTILSAVLWAGVFGNSDRHEALRSDIEQLRLAESRFRELVLRYRHDASANYDEGNRWADRIALARMNLAATVRGIPALEAVWRETQLDSATLGNHWNDFKFRNAQIRNSLDQFQRLTTDLPAALPKSRPGEAVRRDLMALSNRLLTLTLGRQDGDGDTTAGLIARLHSQEHALPASVHADFDRLIRHAEVIVAQTPFLAADVDRLTDTAAVAHLQRLDQANRTLLEAEEDRANVYRMGLVICVTVLAQILIGLAVRFLDNLRRLGAQGRFFESVSNHAGVGILAMSSQGTVTFANPLAEHMLARIGEPLVGRHLHDDIQVTADGQPMDPADCPVCEAVRSGSIYSGEQLLRRGDGTLMPVHMTSAPLAVDDGIGAVTVFQDISERMGKEKDLRLAGTVFENSHQGIVVTDASGTIVRVNPAYCHITGYGEEELIGENPRITKSGLQDKGFYREMWASLTATGRWQGEMRNRRKNGELYTQWANIDAVRTERGELLYVGIVSDITELVETRERLTTMAYFDPLTGLPNRVLFRDRLRQALMQARRGREVLALIYADLDNFKTINDTLGHAAGDELLVEAARRFQSCLRESDTVARLGGDEFAMVLMDAKGPQDMATLADEIIAAMSVPFRVDGCNVTSGVSLGITFWPADGDSPDELLKHADVAMYRAKERGRNHYQFFTGDMAASVADHMRIENGLRHALAAGELSLYFQPQLSPDGKTVSAEALMRWESPELGWVPPSRFIPVAEKSGLITAMGNFALRESCRMCRRWRDLFAPDMRVSVNLSALQFRQEGLVGQVADCLHEFSLPGSALELELTETVVMDDVAHGLETLNQLKRLGCRLAIDDFGTGYSSLAYLKRFPVDVLKVDRAFIVGLGTRADDTLVVQAIIGLAASLGLEVVAEGVETLSQLEILKHSADNHKILIQGYFFSPPLPAAEFELHFPNFRQLKLVAN